MSRSPTAPGMSIVDCGPSDQTEIVKQFIGYNKEIAFDLAHQDGTVQSWLNNNPNAKDSLGVFVGGGEVSFHDPSVLEHAKAVSSFNFEQGEDHETEGTATQGNQRAERNEDGKLLRKIYYHPHPMNTCHPASDRIESGMETFKHLASQLDHQPELLGEVHAGLYEDEDQASKDALSLLNEFVEDRQVSSPGTVKGSTTGTRRKKYQGPKGYTVISGADAPELGSAKSAKNGKAKWGIF